MRTKAAASAVLPIRRGLSEQEAAIYLSLSAGTFRKLVEDGAMPRPRLIGTRRVWDITEIDHAFNELPREGGEPAMADTWADFN